MDNIVFLLLTRSRACRQNSQILVQEMLRTYVPRGLAPLCAKIFLVIQSHLPPTYTRRTSALISVCLVLKSTLLVHWACSMALQQKTITQHQVQQKSWRRKAFRSAVVKQKPKLSQQPMRGKKNFSRSQ